MQILPNDVRDRYRDIYNKNYHFRQFIDYLAVSKRVYSSYKLRSLTGIMECPSAFARTVMTLLVDPTVARILPNGALEFTMNSRDFARQVQVKYEGDDPLIQSNNNEIDKLMKMLSRNDVDYLLNSMARLMRETIEKHSSNVAEQSSSTTVF